VLGHGALVQDLAGEDKLGIVFGHQVLGLAEHEDAAVQAGIHGRAVAVLGLEEDLLEVLPGDVDDFDGDVQVGTGPQGVVRQVFPLVLPTADDPPVVVQAEARAEVDGDDVHALVFQDPAGQGAVQTAR
jgi:hypothetical protein